MTYVFIDKTFCYLMWDEDKKDILLQCVPTPVFFLLLPAIVVILKYSVPMWITIAPKEISGGCGFSLRVTHTPTAKNCPHTTHLPKVNVGQSVFGALGGSQRQGTLVLH